MAGNIVDFDAGYNVLGQEGTADAQIKSVKDYLYQLMEQLRYVLRNIGLENLNESAVKELNKLITDPINARIEDDEGRLTEVGIEAGRINLVVADDESTGKIVLTPGMAEAMFKVINLYGAVTFYPTDADHYEQGGSTTIDGGSITTGTINANDLFLTGAFTLVNNDTDYGFIGCGYGNDGYNPTYGAVLAGPNPATAGGTDNYVIVTNKGIRLQVGDDYLYIADGNIVASRPISVPVQSQSVDRSRGEETATLQSEEGYNAARITALERQVAYLTARLAEQEQS